MENEFSAVFAYLFPLSLEKKNELEKPNHP